MQFFLAIAVLISGLNLAGFYTTRAQADDDTVQYSHGLPVTGEDTLSQQTDTVDREPKDIQIKVKNDQIPAALRATLMKGEQYIGWERSAIFFERNTRLFVVRIKQGETTRIYRFNGEGNVVSYNEKSGNDN